MKNQSTCSSEAALREAIKFAGGQSALARVCNKQQGHVSHWLKSGKGVPAEYCPLIEEATGVTCERLRPDVRWDVVRLAMAPITQPPISDLEHQPCLLATQTFDQFTTTQEINHG